MNFIDKSLSVEVRVRSYKQLMYFDEIPELQNAVITGIECQNFYDSTNQKTPLGLGSTAISNGKYFFLNLKYQNKELYKRFPLLYFVRSSVQARNLFKTAFRPDITGMYDLAQSYIECNNTNIGETPATYFVFNIHYTTKERFVLLCQNKLSDLNNLKIKVETIEVPIRTVSDKIFYFPEIKNLLNKKVLGMRISEENLQKSPLGRSIYYGFFAFSAYLNLFANNHLSIQNLAIARQYMYTGDNTEFLFNFLPVDWAKSFIRYTGTNNFPANSSYLFNIYYID